MIVERGWQCPSGMLHRPLVWSHKPIIMTRLCFMIFTSNLVNMATHSSLQIFPMDMSELVVMSLKTWEDCALEERLFESCNVVLKAGLMMFELAT